MFSRFDKKRDAFMLDGSFADQGYDWWWHSFTAVNSLTGEEKSFFIEYFTCNPARCEAKPVFGQLIENALSGKKPSYVMIKAGWWGEDHAQLHRFFPWTEVAIHKDAPYSVEADDCFAGEYELRGSVNVSEDDAKAHPEWMSDAGSMKWDIRLNKLIPYNVGYGAGSIFRKLKAFEMYWHAEGMKTLYSGTIIANGVRYDVIPGQSYGYADKNWGSDFTSPWLWLSSNDLVSKISGKRLLNSAFDIGGGRPKAFGIPLMRTVLSAFYYEGYEFEFNFSKFWTGSHTKFAVKETDDKVIWHVRQESVRAVADVVVECMKKDMLFVNYESPDGRKRHERLWNGGNGKGTVKLYEKGPDGLYLVDELKAEHVGCEYGEYSKSLFA